MRVVHLIERLDGYGTSEPLRSLAISQASRGIEVAIVAFNADRRAAARLQSQGVQILTAERRWQIDPLALLRVALWLRQPHDVLHAWGEKAIVLATRLTNQAAGSRLASLMDTPLLSTRAIRRLANACALCDAVVVLGQASLPWNFEVLGQEGSSQPPIVHAARSIQPWNPPPRIRSEVLADWGIPRDVRLIVTAGPLVRRRRLDEAIWNFELVRTLSERIVFVIVGDGPDWRRLVQFAAQVSDPASVVFVGYREDWRDLLPHADVYWEVSPPVGALPQAACEALVARVPVVAGRSVQCADLIRVDDTSAAAPLWVEAVGRIGFAKYTYRLLADRSALGDAASAMGPHAVNADELLAATGRKLCSCGDMAPWDAIYASVATQTGASNGR